MENKEEERAAHYTSVSQTERENKKPKKKHERGGSAQKGKMLKAGRPLKKIKKRRGCGVT